MDHTYREIVLKITFITLWFFIFFLYLTSLNSSPADSKHPRWLNSTSHMYRMQQDRCPHCDTRKGQRKKRCFTKISQTLHVWGYGGTVHDLDLYWNLHLRSPVLDTVLLSNPDFSCLHEKSLEKKVMDSFSAR